MVIKSLMAFPRGFPCFTSRFRSASVMVIRLGSLLRRIRFSTFRYSRYFASCLSVAYAIKKKGVENLGHRDKILKSLKRMKMSTFWTHATSARNAIKSRSQRGYNMHLPKNIILEAKKCRSAQMASYGQSRPNAADTMQVVLHH